MERRSFPLRFSEYLMSQLNCVPPRVHCFLIKTTHLYGACCYRTDRPRGACATRRPQATVYSRCSAESPTEASTSTCRPSRWLRCARRPSTRRWRWRRCCHCRMRGPTSSMWSHDTCGRRSVVLISNVVGAVWSAWGALWRWLDVGSGVGPNLCGQERFSVEVRQDSTLCCWQALRGRSLA
jgi:hypothetical protein